MQCLFSQVTFRLRANYEALDNYMINTYKCCNVYEDDIELKTQNKWKKQKDGKLVFLKNRKKCILE